MADLDNNTSLKVALDEIEKKVAQSEVDRNTLEVILPTKGIEVLPGAKMSTLVNSVGEIELGRKWEKGSGTYQYGSGAKNTFTVRGLSFKPKIIIIHYRAKEDSEERMAVYNYEVNPSFITAGYINYSFNPSYALGDKPIKIYDDGFSCTLPYGGGYNTTQVYNCDWVAFE